ncbi:MAG: hypothetical protein HXY40_08435 [Chloroflexi bacterium]|nr:hypothetical protein [Chloroflexota bacterium]
MMLPKPSPFDWLRGSLGAAWRTRQTVPASRMTLLTYIALGWALAWLLVGLLGLNAVLLAVALYCALIVLNIAPYYRARYKNWRGALLPTLLLTAPALGWALALLIAAQIQGAPLWLIGLGLIFGLWLLGQNLPVWMMEMRPGKVYLFQHASAMEDDFDLVPCPAPPLDPALMRALIENDFPPPSLNVYVEWGLPDFLRDELYLTQVRLTWNKLSALAAEMHMPPLRPEDLRAIEIGHKDFHALLRQYVELAQGAPRLLALEQQFHANTDRLRQLFTSAAAVRRRFVPVRWIVPADHWRLLWDNNRFVPVEAVMQDVDTLKNVRLDLTVKCLVTFDAHKLRNPSLRLALRAKTTPDEVAAWIAAFVRDSIVRETHHFFYTMQSRQALETGVTEFARQLPQLVAGALATMNVTLHPWSIDCVPRFDGEILRIRKQEFENEAEMLHIKELLSAGNLTEQQQAEFLLRLLMIQSMPARARSVPPLNFAPPAAAPAPPPTRQLPPSAHTSKPPAAPPPPAHTHTPPTTPRRKPRKRTSDLDDIIDTYPDPDDPDSFSPR